MSQVTFTERNQAINLLSDTEALVLLSSYAEQERNVTNASIACDIDYQKAFYLTKKLLNLKLIEVTTEPGKQKRYKAVSKRVIIPPEASPFPTLETMLLELGNFRNLCAYSADMLQEKRRTLQHRSRCRR